MGRIAIPKFSRLMRHRTAPGAAPGTLVEPVHLPKPGIERIVYDAGSFTRETIDHRDIAGALTVPEGKRVWLDVQGLGDVDVIQALGDALGLHPLTVEDIVHVHQRPKQEAYPAYLFVVLRALRVLADNTIDSQQISLILKENLIVTFHERPGELFAPVRQRIKDGKGLIRQAGPSYLFYALVDAVIDNYFPVLEKYDENMDSLEDAVRDDPTPDISRDIHGIRRQLRRFRRSVRPLRDLLNAVARDEIALIDETVRLFLRDCHDHILQVAEFVESSRERASDLDDLYMSVVSEKTNRVMNLLTIIATIFIPLTFLCGIYGMNFDTEVSPFNMPELKWRYGYPIFWGVLITIFVAMLLVFRSKGWIGKKH